LWLFTFNRRKEGLEETVYYWFSNYRGSDWSPSNGGCNQKFRNTLEMVRNWFYLRRDTAGRDIGLAWKEYCLDERSVEVCVTEFTWNSYFISDGQTYIRFYLRIKLRWYFSEKIFFDDELIIEFPKNYSESPPKFYIKKYTRHGASSDYHLLSNGRLCILTNEKDWGPGDTIISAINVALKWIVKHNIKYGE
jgi:hypothetical protein